MRQWAAPGPKHFVGSAGCEAPIPGWCRLTGALTRMTEQSRTPGSRPIRASIHVFSTHAPASDLCSPEACLMPATHVLSGHRWVLHGMRQPGMSQGQQALTSICTRRFLTCEQTHFVSHRSLCRRVSATFLASCRKVPSVVTYARVESPQHFCV